ncbi:MAG TPA: UvrD-helicase domain-containing protein [Sphingopyxis sp.]|nr:UvrD-helicase domain-containing protein [Sphingopyxis sp.]
MSKATPLVSLDRHQGAAADPAHHVWLGASAGTGKTQVLSARVLRLMLEGVSPEAILCITFTKAGAAEMAHRIHERLATWVRLADAELRLDLQALGLDWSRDGLMARARSLFAMVIDSPGGSVRVQTIHSFCQTLLASFPLEARLLPGFRPIEEDEAAALKRQVLIGLLAEQGAEGDQLRDAAATLARRMGQDMALQYLSSCAASFGGPQPVLPPSRHDLRSALDLPTQDSDAYLADIFSGGVVADTDVASVAASGAAWGTKTGLDYADRMAEWLAAGAAQKPLLIDSLLSAILTDKLEIRACYASEKGRMKDCLPAAERIVLALQQVRDTVTAMRVADELAVAWRLGSRFAESYALAKRERGFADFDDLIILAGSLLRLSSFGEWVRFKLDQRTDHILVDEAQDTNLRQWGIIISLAQEYFAVHREDDDRKPTLFTVGDKKQSIYGFQGTEPGAFQKAREIFELFGAQADQPLHRVNLISNYRSTPAVLHVVDQWIKAGGAADMGLEEVEPAHQPFRSSHAGQVELWQPLPVGQALAAQREADGADNDGDKAAIAAALAEDQEQAASDELEAMGASGGAAAAPASDPASMRLANAIADEIRLWLLHGKDGRPVVPGDIMVLVRRRRDLAARIVARLQALDIDVAGVDRFALTQPLAVQDLIAAMRFAVQPADDLNLAALLVSPLIGWTQDELYARIGQRGRAAIWPHLRAHEGELPAETMAALRHLLAMADLATPFRFLDRILSGPMDGRRKLYGRLGREARDPIDELLNQALSFEQQQSPSLLGFLDYIDASAMDIKRQTEARSDAVRVMTVHGSKGLQAPIVILADATDEAAFGHRPFPMDLAAWEKLPVFALSKAEQQGRVAEAYAAGTKAARQEDWRLFYVAMTRAEEILVIAGTTKAADGSVKEGSWHAAAERVLVDMKCAWEDAGPRWRQRLVYRAASKKWDHRGKKRAAAPAPVKVPDWALRPAPEEARPPRPLAPSQLGADDVASPPMGVDRASALSRGLLLHALFERLPPVRPARRRAAAESWLAAQAPDIAIEERAAMVSEVLRIVDDPAYAEIFGPDSLAEVPLSAVVEGGLVVAGIVDRLLVTPDLVTVIDYKTGHVPETAADVAPAYLRQMAAYRAALMVIFPGRTIRAALIYTASARWIALDDTLLALHKPGFTDGKGNLTS